MSGNYLANINTVTYVDSFQSVLVNSDTLGTSFELAARTALTSDSSAYFADLTWNATSSTANLEIKIAGGGTIGSLTTAIAITTAPTYDLEFEVVTVNSTTTDLYAKVWAITGTEPTTWQISATDSTGALQNGNSSNVDGMKFILTGTSENTFLVDNYEAVNLVSSNASYIDNFQNNSTAGWSPLTASHWSVGTQGNATNGYSVRYYINTSSYAEGANSTLGEYSLLGQSGFTDVGDFTMTLDAAAARPPRPAPPPPSSSATRMPTTTTSWSSTPPAGPPSCTRWWAGPRRRASAPPAAARSSIPTITRSRSLARAAPRSRSGMTGRIRY